MARTDAARKGANEKMTTIITDWAQWISGQTAASGALAILYSATAPELDGRHAALEPGSGRLYHRSSSELPLGVGLGVLRQQ
jgi:hypothetical protein